MSEIDPDDHVVDAVRALASPRAGGHDRAAEMLAAVERTQRTQQKRRRTGVSLLAAAAVVVAGTVGVTQLLPDPSPSTDATGGVVPEPTQETAWEPMSESPLSPRHSSQAVWTGEEVVIVGGRTGFVCPPNADCASQGDLSHEAAAYNPATDTWRTLPDLPVPMESKPDTEAGRGGLVWDGDEVVAMTNSLVFALKPDGERWEQRALVPADPDVVPSSDRSESGTDLVVYAAYNTGDEGSADSDWVFDPATGVRTSFPSDDLGESYDRSITFDGERFWMLSMSGDEHFAAADSAPSRLAVLEDGQWRLVDDETPPVTYRQRLRWDGSRLVIAPIEGADGHVYDPATQKWTTVASPLGAGSSTPGACLAPPAGPGPEWISGVDGVLAHGDRAIALPDCQDVFDAAGVAVWAGDELLLWGGAGPDGDDKYRVTAAGLRWTPPAP